MYDALKISSGEIYRRNYSWVVSLWWVYAWMNESLKVLTIVLDSGIHFYIVTPSLLMGGNGGTHVAGYKVARVEYTFACDFHWMAKYFYEIFCHGSKIDVHMGTKFSTIFAWCTERSEMAFVHLDMTSTRALPYPCWRQPLINIVHFMTSTWKTVYKIAIIFPFFHFVICNDAYRFGPWSATESDLHGSDLVS